MGAAPNRVWRTLATTAGIDAGVRAAADETEWGDAGYQGVDAIGEQWLIAWLDEVGQASP